MKKDYLAEHNAKLDEARKNFKVSFFDGRTWGIILWMLCGILGAFGVCAMTMLAFTVLGWIGIHFAAVWFYIAPVAVWVFCGVKAWDICAGDPETDRVAHEAMAGLGYKSTKEYYKAAGI